MRLDSSKKSEQMIRNSQIGSGMRGDKRRTIQVRHGIVKDHISGKSWTYDNYENGRWD